ncbi:uncharacterized protein BROUX77_007776 [Berkeleyomyces rouxiae]|uniref:uncharacterized protein n=1 Tax=Berkeleyomyces rouxiae TaxID=2035830 RepID=UPI003B7629B8
MEALAAATSVIALVELAAKIGSLCLQYSKAVKNSSTEISRLQEEIARLENVTKQVHDINLLHKLWLKTILDTLPTANGASFDSHDESRNAVCLPGTRMELINDIKKWASDASSESLFWLKGMAGTGKSTISRTICRSFEECGQLGASFFFKRGEGDRGNLSRFVTTLAAQLTEKYPDFAQNINTAIGDDKSIVRKGPEDQFKKLIEEPLGKIPHGPHKGPSIVFVIDALDECDNDDDIELIIRLFSSCAKVANPNMKPKWLITSRPELHIRLGFGAISGKFQDLVLHDKSPNSIERDIATFLKHELERIKTRDLRSLKMILEPEGSETLEALLEDASHFIQRDLSTITKTPLQLYSSLLAFAPKNSLVRRIFEQDIPKWMMLKPQTDNEWLQKQETLERHNDKVFSVVFSPDGKLVASASMDLKIERYDSGDLKMAPASKSFRAKV